jgi:hypothetical protein
MPRREVIDPYNPPRLAKLLSYYDPMTAGGEEAL